MNASSSTDDGSRLRDDADFYKAAAEGRFEKFENYPQPLDLLLLGKHQNTILHLHLNSPFKRSKDFVEKVLGQCRELLWKSNNDGAIPLHIAAKHGHLDIVQVLIQEAKKATQRDLETGEEEVRRMLRLTNKQNETALYLAVRVGGLDVVKEILKHEDPHFTYTANISGESPLYLAIDKVYVLIATEILKKFESPDCSGPNGTTVFHAPSLYRHFKASDCDNGFFDLLLSKLWNFVNQADENGWVPLHYAAYFDEFQMVRKILDKDKWLAYATDKDRNRTALHIAAGRGQVSVMKAIIDRCPECCEIRDVRGWNFLHYAVVSKSEKAVRATMHDPSLVYLINERDIKGYTPLHLLLLLLSSYSTSLHSWIESALPSNLLSNEIMYLFRHDAFEANKNKDKEFLEWTQNLGDSPFGKKIQVDKHWKQVQNERQEDLIPELKKAKDSHLVAAALVATVTFAAAFTLPGGYISDESNSNLKGTPILSKNAAFIIFIVTDAIAMVLSTSSVFIHFLMVMLGYKQRYYWLIRWAFWFVVLAMGAMVVAFVTGTYAVLAPSSMGLAITTCVIGLTFFLHAAYTTIRLIFDFIGRDRIEHRDSSTTESIRRVLRSAPQHLCDMWRPLVLLVNLDEDSEILEKIPNTDSKPFPEFF